MRRLSRIGTVVAATGLLTLGQLSTAEAATQWPPPPDCTVSTPWPGAESLTCTSRPAAQQWRLIVYCWPFGKLTLRYGNLVTGNGTSTADCGAPEIGPDGELFVTYN